LLQPEQVDKNTIHDEYILVGFLCEVLKLNGGNLLLHFFVIIKRFLNRFMGMHVPSSSSSVLRPPSSSVLRQPLTVHIDEVALHSLSVDISCSSVSAISVHVKVMMIAVCCIHSVNILTTILTSAQYQST
jgi:hypothetical protein